MIERLPNMVRVKVARVCESEEDAKDVLIQYEFGMKEGNER